MDKTDDHSVLLLNQTCISTDDVILLCFMTVSFCKFYRCCVLITLSLLRVLLSVSITVETTDMDPCPVVAYVIHFPI